MDFRHSLYSENGYIVVLKIVLILNFQIVSKQPSMDLTDDQELDFIALLSSVGDDISMHDASIHDPSNQDTITEDCSVQNICSDYSKMNDAGMTDVMSLVLSNQPGQVVTVRTTQAISNLVQTGFEQLATVDVETGTKW